jgi:hypothetical protein
VIVPPEELEALLRAHAYLQVDRPPRLWGLHTTGLEPFVRALGESIAAGLVRNGNDLGALTLSIANAHTEDDGAEYVAVTIMGAGRWTDATWRPGGSESLAGPDLSAAADAAGAAWGYVRDLGAGAGSVTVLYPRAH